MIIKEIKTEKGVLKYKMPSIPECNRLLSISGISEGILDPYIIKANVQEGARDLFDTSEIEGKPTIEEVMQDPENFYIAINEATDDIVGMVFLPFKKKAI